MYPRLRRLALMALLAVLVSAIAGPPLVQANYPERPITLIIPWPPGGTSDQTARVLAAIAEKELGQPFKVENRPGAGSIVGIAELARAKPDGYTIGLLSVPFLRAPHQRPVPFNPLTDFSHIIQYGDNLIGFAVRADSPWETWEDFVEDARANPGYYTFATGGVGTSQHMTFEAIMQAEGLEVVHIPYSGGGETVPALLGGHVDGISEVSAWAPHVQSGELRLLLTYTRERTSLFPDVPTMFEKGYTVYFPSPQSFAGPAGMPEEARAKLEAAFYKAMQDPQFIEVANRLNFVIDHRTGAEFTEWAARHFEESREAMAALGLTQD